jgi:hypothetical protein
MPLAVENRRIFPTKIVSVTTHQRQVFSVIPSALFLGFDKATYLENIQSFNPAPSSVNLGAR